MTTIGSLTLYLHMPEARSLKDKRTWVKGLKDRLRKRHLCAAAEVDDQNLLNRSTICVVTVSGQRGHCEEMLQAILRDAESFLGPLIESAEMELLP
jgi:uncharacterized protein